MVRGKVFGQQRAGAEILQQELLDICSIYPAGCTPGETADQRRQFRGMERKAGAGGGGRQHGETQETGAAGVRDDQHEHRAGWADRHYQGLSAVRPL